MVNKCAVYGCESGYTAKKKKKTEDGSNKRPVVAAFRFPLKKSELLVRWVKFINRSEWNPSEHSVICERHFEEKFINRGDKCNLKWKMDPV